MYATSQKKEFIGILALSPSFISFTFFFLLPSETFCLDAPCVWQENLIKTRARIQLFNYSTIPCHYSLFVVVVTLKSIMNES